MKKEMSPASGREGIMRRKINTSDFSRRLTAEDTSRALEKRKPTVEQTVDQVALNRRTTVDPKETVSTVIRQDPQSIEKQIELNINNADLASYKRVFMVRSAKQMASDDLESNVI